MTDFHLDSRFSNYEYIARLALDSLAEFWTEIYGPNEALSDAYAALEAMRDTWEGRDV